MRIALLAAILSLTSLTACNKSNEAQAAADIPAESKQIFEQRCAACHGADGKGSGAAAAAMQPKPRDYTDSAWQGAVTDEQIKTAIVKGGAAVGKSPLMPPNPDLESKPEVVSGLVKMVRSFKK